MKKIYTTLLFVLLATSIFAQGRNRNNYQNRQVNQYQTATAALHLTFAASNNYSITVGTQSFTFYGNQFFFENVTPGLVMVSVRYTANGNNGNTWQTTYNGAINFETNTRIFATIDALGVLRVTQREIILQTTNQPQQPGWPNYQPQPQLVFATQQQTDDLVNRLKNISFDSKKVQAAKNALKSGYYTAQQVKQVLMTFSFDSYKLDVAKLAYDVSYDKTNFFVVGDAFSFSSYADELEKYIASK